MNKFILSNLKLVYTLFVMRKEDYQTFKALTKGKHFYNWQWRLLDKLYNK